MSETRLLPLRRRRRAFVQRLLAVAVVAVVPLSCRAHPPVRVAPVSDAASQAYANAQAALRASDRLSRAVERDHAREFAEEALRLAPDWVAPRRVLDDLLREELRGIEALNTHLSELAGPDLRTPAQVARQLYFAGRLEGRDGGERFERAAALDPNLAWAHHGLAIRAAERGENRAAVAAARRALARARDPWERSFFTSSLAHFLVAVGDRQEGLAMLAARSADPDASAADRAWLGVETVGIGLQDSEAMRRAASYARGLELLRDLDLTEGDVATLVERLRSVGSPEDPDGQALVLALAVRASPARDRLRAELMLEAESTPLALGLLERALQEQGRSVPAGPLMRAARFAAQQFSPAVERWLADLPARVRGADGLPADARLARVVRDTRALAGSATDPERANALAELGDALIDAGWFREARSVSLALAQHELDRALDLESRALAGQELVDGLRRLVTRVELERGLTAPLFSESIDLMRLLRSGDAVAPERVPTKGWKISDLDGLLAAMGPLFARANVFLGGDTDAERVARELSSGPRLAYGPVAEIAHPGPWFSAEDEKQGLGTRGDTVPGLAAQMARLGRFALFGELAGNGGPDGTILPRVWVEERSGRHVATPWSGTVAWCEGADLLSRAGRRGAHISAAALHEGYWLDIGAVRAEHGAWEALRREFSGPESAQRVAHALDERGLELGPPDDTVASRRARTRTGALLGEAQRVRLAVLLDRGRAAHVDGLGSVTLDELIDVTATHEEGHLCDRTRFLPLERHIPALLEFLLDCGFSPTRVGEELEYRAQLTALCDAADPRIPLVQLLESVEQGPSGLTAHAPGYARLLDDFLGVLDARLERAVQDFPDLDREHLLAHQLHRLSQESVRSIARELASQRRMDR